MQERAATTRAGSPHRVEFYEGLVRKTAARYEPYVEEEYEDLCSLFRIKAWRALESFDPEKSRIPVERYVFSCMVNLGKDLLKKHKRNEAYIEDFAGEDESGVDHFESQYLAQDEDSAFRELTSLDQPLIPSTLTSVEVRVVLLLYCDRSYAEIALAVGVAKRDVAAAVKSVKEKMADWRPTPDASPDQAVPRTPTPADSVRVAA